MACFALVSANEFCGIKNFSFKASEKITYKVYYHLGMMNVSAGEASFTANYENYKGKPMWVKNQRNSWHGVDFPYHSDLNVTEYKRQYNRALSAVDDSLGRITDWLKANKYAGAYVMETKSLNLFIFDEKDIKIINVEK